MGERIRVAYADSPYLGCCRLYGHEHGGGSDMPWDGACWDDPRTHEALIAWLTAEFPDGWALSATSVSLRTILPMCPPDVRVASWVKPFHVYKKGVRPAYSWEPIIYRRGRQEALAPPKGGKAITPKDHLITEAPDAVACNITLKKGLTGAKPEKVCHWLFDLLGLRPGDELVDLFPGTGVVSEAWTRWVAEDVGADFTATAHLLEATP